MSLSVSVIAGLCQVSERKFAWTSEDVVGHELKGGPTEGATTEEYGNVALI